MMASSRRVPLRSSASVGFTGGELTALATDRPIVEVNDLATRPAADSAVGALEQYASDTSGACDPGADRYVPFPDGSGG